MEEKLKMSEVWKFKLRELRLQEALLKMDQSRRDELIQLQEMIEQVRMEYKKELVKELSEEKNKEGRKTK